MAQKRSRGARPGRQRFREQNPGFLESRLLIPKSRKTCNRLGVAAVVGESKVEKLLSMAQMTESSRELTESRQGSTRS